MKRGTTPFLPIKTDQDLSQMDYIVVTIEDIAGTEVSVDNKSGMMDVKSGEITVKLTQEQTLSLSEGELQIQIRASDSAGENAIASNIMYSTLDDVLKDGVIP